MSDRTALFGLLESRTGMNVEALGGEHSLDFTIQRCIEAGEFTSHADWFTALRESPAVWEKFLHEIVVPETFFFRYPESYQALASWVTEPVPRRRPLRILSLPCSTGEEPYSIAISLSEAGFAPQNYEITGLDIDGRAVEFAEKGCYHRSSSFRSSETPRPEGYFAEHADGRVTVRKFIRQRVKFRTGSFWSFPIENHGWDVIFCRNLLIYFSEEKQIAALEKLTALLHSDGILFLGPAEVPVALKCGWRSAGYSMGFACRKSEGSAPTPVPFKFVKPALKPLAPPVEPTRAISPKQPPPPAPVPAALSLADIRSLADRGEVAEARRALATYLPTAPTDPDAHTLAGVLAEASGDSGSAEEAFRRALYLDPQHAEALSHLAWLLQTHGRGAAAQKLLDRAERLHLSR